MGNYFDIMLSVVKSGAKYCADGTRYSCVYLQKNLPDIFEKMPDETSANVYKKLCDLAENPQMTIYSAARALMSGQNARGALDKLYKRISLNALKDGNKRRAGNFEQCRQNIRTLSDKETYLQLLDSLYKDMRTAEYGISCRRALNIDEITSKGNSLMSVRAENGWHYRIPRGKSAGKAVDRVSVNALGDEGLIKALDELLGSGKVKGYYKTPDLTDNWLERHDPVTIYLTEKATPEVLTEIKKACEKYIRSTDDVLIGEKFAPGFALQKSPTKADIEVLLTRASKLDPELEQALRKYFANLKDGEVKISAGYLEAANKLLNTLEK